MSKLTKRFVDSLKSADRDYIAFDDEVKGFGVRVLRTGVKTYLVQYRTGGRTRRVKIGRHGVLTADQARGRAKELLGAVAGGDNPAQAISDHRTAPTVATVCDRFIRDHVEQRLKPTTLRDYKAAIHRLIKPELGTFKIVDVTRTDVAKLHHKLRETPYQANRAVGLLSKLFNLCEVWGLRPDGSNPCRHVRKYPERRRETFLTPEELRNLGKVLSRVEADGSNSRYIVAAFRLLILTGCRLREIQMLKWSYVQDRYICLPDSKTGARRIPLTPDAIEVLENLPRVQGNEYVIVGDVEGQCVTDLEKPWRRIRGLAKLDHVRIHDLRHTYASNAVKQGLDISMVGKLLGHSQIQSTMRYVHLADDAVRAAAARVGGSLGEAIKSAKPDTESPPEPPSNVIKFPAKRMSESAAVSR